jgi:hypothetical protein
MANPQSLKNWHLETLLMLLSQNPGQQFFPMINCVEYPFYLYPQGVPRVALLNEFNSKCDIANQQNGGLGLDIQVYGLANLPATVNVPPSPQPITKQSQVS